MDNSNKTNRERECYMCDGTGEVSNVAATYLNFALFSIPSSFTKKCEKCNGTGKIDNI